MRFTMNLSSDVSFIIEKLENSGFCAHVVGGAVRDSLLGRELSDFDITTDASPEQTKAVFENFKTVDTGIKHGTVTVVINHTPYEITTYRIDGDYKDNRHPETVTFTKNLSDDLCRRDFTVNAMAYSARDGLTDLFGGASDVDAKLIRAVGEAERRFDEDALRILRAFRFAAVLDFCIEEDTARAAVAKADRLEGVSGERIYTELKKLLMGKAASRILRAYPEALAYALGGLLVRDYPSDEVLRDFSFTARLAALFLLNSDSPIEAAKSAFDRLKADNLTRIAVINAIFLYLGADFSSERGMLYALSEYGEEHVRGAIDIGLITGRFGEAETNLIDKITSGNPVYKISDLKIGGGELMKLGFKGREVGAALTRLLCAVIDKECENEPDALIAYLSK